MLVVASKRECETAKELLRNPVVKKACNVIEIDDNMPEKVISCSAFDATCVVFSRKECRGKERVVTTEDSMKRRN